MLQEPYHEIAFFCMTSIRIRPGETDWQIKGRP
jgi:hypothetical protein